MTALGMVLALPPTAGAAPAALDPDAAAISVPALTDSGPLTPPPLDLAAVRVTAEPGTVEDHLILHAYDWLKGRHYRAWRIDFPGTDGTPGTAHLLLPTGEGPHPAVLVFPILGGSHIVSEALAKSFANRGYAVLRVERRRLFPRADEEYPDLSFARPAAALRTALLDGRRLLDWLEQHPQVDPDRLAVAGVSIGGIMAATLMGVDDRLQAGVFIMAGGGLPELLHDSLEPPLVRFRERVLATIPDRRREAFLDDVRPHTLVLDPLTWASRVDPSRVVLVTGRFDRIVPPDRSEALWEAMGRPSWHRYPAGHYGIAPFFWWAAGRGAELLDDVLGAPAPTPVGASTSAGR